MPKKPRLRGSKWQRDNGQQCPVLLDQVELLLDDFISCVEFASA